VGDNQVGDNQVKEKQVGDKNGGYFDRVILTVLRELGDYPHNQ